MADMNFGVGASPPTGGNPEAIKSALGSTVGGLGLGSFETKDEGLKHIHQDLSKVNEDLSQMKRTIDSLSPALAKLTPAFTKTIGLFSKLLGKNLGNNASPQSVNTTSSVPDIAGMLSKTQQTTTTTAAEVNKRYGAAARAERAAGLAGQIPSTTTAAQVTFGTKATDSTTGRLPTSPDYAAVRAAKSGSTTAPVTGGAGGAAAKNLAAADTGEFGAGQQGGPHYGRAVFAQVAAETAGSINTAMASAQQNVSGLYTMGAQNAAVYGGTPEVNAKALSWDKSNKRGILSTSAQDLTGAVSALASNNLTQNQLRNKNLQGFMNTAETLNTNLGASGAANIVGNLTNNKVLWNLQQHDPTGKMWSKGALINPTSGGVNKPSETLKSLFNVLTQTQGMTPQQMTQRAKSNDWRAASQVGQQLGLSQDTVQLVKQFAASGGNLKSAEAKMSGTAGYSALLRSSEGTTTQLAQYSGAQGALKTIDNFAATVDQAKTSVLGFSKALDNAAVLGAKGAGGALGGGAVQSLAMGYGFSKGSQLAGKGLSTIAGTAFGGKVLGTKLGGKLFGGAAAKTAAAGGETAVAGGEATASGLLGPTGLPISSATAGATTAAETAGATTAAETAGTAVGGAVAALPIAGYLGGKLINSVVSGNSKKGSARHKTGSVLGGAATGAGIGAGIGLLAGPLDPISVPVGAAVGGLIGGVTGFFKGDPGTGSTTTGGLQPQLSQRMQSMMRDNPNIKISSGHRTASQQQNLYNIKGGKGVARPGHSEHQSGKAVDVGPPSQFGWLSKNAGKYGLHLPAPKSEPWHLQAMGDPVSNPVSGLTQGRVDQGVDYSGKGTVNAVGSGTIVRVQTSGWGSMGNAGIGACIVLKLDNPPDAQHTMVYYAENIVPSVKVGQHVSAGEVIGQATGTGSGIEIGWGDQNGNPLAPLVKGNEGGKTSEGNNFSDWLKGAVNNSGTSAQADVAGSGGGNDGATNKNGNSNTKKSSNAGGASSFLSSSFFSKVSATWLKGNNLGGGGGRSGGGGGNSMPSNQTTAGTGSAGDTTLMGASSDKSIASPTEFSKKLLSALGIPATVADVTSINAWQQREGQWTVDPTIGGQPNIYFAPNMHNPLNTNWQMPEDKGLSGTRAYKTWADGILASKNTILQDNMSPILKSLKANDNLKSFSDATSGTPWASSHYPGGWPSPSGVYGAMGDPVGGTDQVASAMSYTPSQRMGDPVASAMMYAPSSASSSAAGVSHMTAPAAQMTSFTMPTRGSQSSGPVTINMPIQVVGVSQQDAQHLAKMVISELKSNSGLSSVSRN